MNPSPKLGIMLLMLMLASLACSADELIGQRPSGPTPTLPSFATATPGGRVSVWLVTPAGQAPLVTPTAAPVGSIIAPAATATAAFATLQAATAVAGVTLSAPIYQPNDCPAPGGPLPPNRPATFGQYAQVIGQYLSAGGPTTTLESTLRAWGAIVEGHGILQANTDLTGDGVIEIIITLVDPAAYNPKIASPGQLLVFGCSQKGYRLLYSTPYSGSTMLPELKRVGDMNGDSRAELAFTQQICNNGASSGTCTQTMQILSWNAVIGAFTPLNDGPMDSTNAKVSIGDVDNDGILEVSITFNPPPDPNAGPFRRTTQIWDWNGVNYVMALTQREAPVYRIHAVYDADETFAQGDFRAALKQYDRVRDDPNLQGWGSPNELSVLRAYAAYRKLLAYAALKQNKGVQDMVNTLQTENPAGSSAEVWGQLGSAFMDAYKSNRTLKKVCAATLNFINARPDLLGPLNSYGSANPNYVAQALCPF